MTSLGFRDPEIGRGVPNHARLSKINKQTWYLYFTFHWFSVQNKLTVQRGMQYCECGRVNISTCIPFAR